MISLFKNVNKSTKSYIFLMKLFLFCCHIPRLMLRFMIEKLCVAYYVFQLAHCLTDKRAQTEFREIILQMRNFKIVNLLGTTHPFPRRRFYEKREHSLLQSSVPTGTPWKSCWRLWTVITLPPPVPSNLNPLIFSTAQ